MRFRLNIKVTGAKNAIMNFIDILYKNQRSINRFPFAVYGALRRVASGRFARRRIVGSNKEQKTESIISRKTPTRGEVRRLARAGWLAPRAAIEARPGRKSRTGINQS